MGAVKKPGATIGVESIPVTKPNTESGEKQPAKVG